LQQTAKWGSFAIEATSEIVMAANQIFLIILAIAAIASFYLHVASVK
jgi:hypothetical protein